MKGEKVKGKERRSIIKLSDTKNKKQLNLKEISNTGSEHKFIHLGRTFHFLLLNLENKRKIVSGVAQSFRLVLPNKNYINDRCELEFLGKRKVHGKNGPQPNCPPPPSALIINSLGSLSLRAIGCVSRCTVITSKGNHTIIKNSMPTKQSSQYEVPIFYIITAFV